MKIQICDNHLIFVLISGYIKRIRLLRYYSKGDVLYSGEERTTKFIHLY